MDLFDIDIHIFTVIKFLFNLGVRFNYIYLKVKFNINNKIITVVIYILNSYSQVK